ncbi:hypothetical protein ADUPG1_001205, partial [Aduncisulcus paluster]
TRKRKHSRDEEIERPVEGTFVWLLPVGKKKGKLQKRRRGPFQVEKVMPNFVVKLRSLLGAATLTVHQRRVAKVVGAHTMKQMQQIAAGGENEFLVDCLLDHRGKSKKELEFLVSWSGDEPEENTWEPYRELKDTIALDEYLEEHEDLKHIIGHP